MTTNTSTPDFDFDFTDSERTQYLFNASQDFVYTGFSSVNDSKKKFFNEVLFKNTQINGSSVRSEVIPQTREANILNIGTINDTSTKDGFNNSSFPFTSTNFATYKKTSSIVPFTKATEGDGFKYVEGTVASTNYAVNDAVTGNETAANIFGGSTSLLGNFNGFNAGPVTFYSLVPMIRVNAAENQSWIACKRHPRSAITDIEFSIDDILSGNLSAIDVKREDLLTNILPFTEGLDATYKPQIYSLEVDATTYTDAVGGRKYELFVDGANGGEALIDANSGVVTFNGFDTVSSRILTNNFKVPHISCYQYTGTLGVSSNMLDSDNTFTGENTFNNNVIATQLSVSNAFAEDVVINNVLHDPTQNSDNNSVLLVDSNNLLGLADNQYSQALQFGSGTGSWRFVVQKVSAADSYTGTEETKFVIQVLDSGIWVEKFSIAHDRERDDD